jgi:hypothetical protein
MGVTEMAQDHDWHQWRRGVDLQLADLTVKVIDLTAKVADLTVKVAVLSRDVRWIGGLILVLLTAQTGAELRR